MIGVDPILDGFKRIRSVNEIPMYFDKEVKNDGDAYPEQCPEKRFPETKLMAFFTEKTQIDGQHEEDKDEERGKKNYFIDI